jgi:hypothetical protein
MRFDYTLKPICLSAGFYPEMLRHEFEEVRGFKSILSDRLAPTVRDTTEF